jgi:hypothetical protein
VFVPLNAAYAFMKLAASAAGRTWRNTRVKYQEEIRGCSSRNMKRACVGAGDRENGLSGYTFGRYDVRVRLIEPSRMSC